MSSSFRSLGFQVFPRIIPIACFNAMRQTVPKSVYAREAAFLTLPSPSDVLTQEVRQEDPMVSSLRKKFAEHKERRKQRRMLMKRRRIIEIKRKKLLMERHRKKMGPDATEEEVAAAAVAELKAIRKQTSSSSSSIKKKGSDDGKSSSDKAAPAPPPPPPPRAAPPVNRNPSLASASDISALSRRITEQLSSISPEQSSIDNDPQRLQAINQHSCNLWMTDPTLAKLVHGADFGKKVLGKIARDHGIESPVLFCDRPVFQLPFGRPTLLHMACPMLGLEQVRGCSGGDGVVGGGQNPNAIAVWVPLSPNVSIRVIERSHTIVEQRMKAEPRALDPRLFRLDFRAVDSNLTLWARRFPEILTPSSSQAQHHATELTNLPPGSAIAFDPFTFAGVAPNVTMDEQAVVQFLIISSKATPSVHPYTWLRDWKSSSMLVDFSNNVVFPQL